MPAASLKPESRVRFSGFDRFVLAGAAVNLLVVAYLVGYWLFAG
ncbi:MAG: hypothetical protein WA210_23600 [Burkholderiaceae bacterium]